MASVSREANGRRTVQFVAMDGKRKSIRLGRVTGKVADAVAARVEHILAAAASKTSIDAETAKWLGEVSPQLSSRLVAVGLTQPRVVEAVPLLGNFMASLLLGRAGDKPNTVRNLQAASSKLVAFFGEQQDLRAVTPAMGDDFAAFLADEYAASTAARMVGYSRQFFRAAVRQKLISDNPFADVKKPPQAHNDRKFFITQAVASLISDACPNAEWRLIFALSRFGGLRCPSETLGVKWTDVDWDRNRLTVYSPKTEHHVGGEKRVVPLFPELRVALEQAFDQAAEGAVYAIARYRDPSKNLRTYFLDIIKKAGVEPWPKLFHNLRASRETELVAEYPLHVVCAWIGNSARIAQKHYLQVREDDFQKAVQNPVQPKAAPKGTERTQKTQHHIENDVVSISSMFQAPGAHSMSESKK